MSKTMDTVTGVHIFPVKSCQEADVYGMPPAGLPVGETGFELHGIRDREFVVVDADASSDGTHLFVSQRGWDENGRPVRGNVDNRLATVRPDIRRDELRLESEAGSVVLQSVYEETPRTLNVRVHGSHLREAIDQGEDAALFFSTVLNRNVRLVRASRSLPRMLPDKHHRPRAENQVAGADGFPFLLTSQSSLDASHDRNEFERGTVPLERYRGNIEIDGMASGPWGEDNMRKLQIAGMIAYAVTPSARCDLTNIDQYTGQRVGKGLRVLRGHGGYTEDPKKPQIYFGMNLNHVLPDEDVQIWVGDEVETLERTDDRGFTLLD